MQRLQQFAISIARWTWFGILLLLAFGYLASGLSTGSRPSLSQSIDSFFDKSVTQTPIRVGADQQATDPKDQANSDQTSIEHAVASVNQARNKHLNSLDLQSAETANWLTICRRLSLSLVGSGLSLEEIRDLERYPEGERERRHLQNLLHDSRYHQYWAERWTRYLVGTDGGQFIAYRRRRFRIWLTEQLSENRPYDEIITDLITAEGLWTDRAEVNFYTATFDSNDGKADPIRLAAKTSRVFLGLRIDCLQCHDDFLGNVNLGDANEIREGKQTDFHQLAAFFTGAKTNFLQGIKSGTADYRYQYLDEDEETEVEPNVPFHTDLIPEHGDPRSRLAAWITHPENQQTARATVSHVWAIIFGRPISESVDNLPLDQPSHPILNILAEDLIKNGFDLRRLITIITRSDAFRISSRADFPITKKHEAHLGVFPLVRLRPEQVAGSIIQSSRIKKTDRESSLFLQFQKLTGINEFVQRYGDQGEDEFDLESVTITQRLLMMNGKMMRESIESNPVLNTSGHLGMFAEDDQMVIESAYLSTINRYPTPDEVTQFSNRLSESTNRSDAIEDLMWVLTNSSEMAWNH